MKKVIVISNTAWNAWNYRHSLNQGLLKAGYRVHVYAAKDGFEKNLLDKMGIPTSGLFLSAKGLNPLIDVVSILQIFCLLLWHRPNFVLTFTVKPVIYGGLACRLLSIPCAPTLTGLGTVFIRESWVTDLVKFLYRFSLKYSKKIIFQNLDDQDLFLKSGIAKRDQTFLVPGSGVNTDEFSIDNFPERSHQEGLIFLLVARMLKDKGIVEYVKAAEELKKKYPLCRFQLLGPADVENRTAIGKDQLEHWQNQGGIEYLGESLDVASYLSKADVAVLPSYREGMPRSLLEAASMSLPLVATDVPGCRDLLTYKNGFLCESHSSDSLAKAMEKMIQLSTQERQEMGRNSRRMILEKFSEKIVVQKYLQVLNF